MEYLICNPETLRKACIDNNWFTCGSSKQYEKLFKANIFETDTLFDLKQVAALIWACSDDSFSFSGIYNELDRLHNDYLVSTGERDILSDEWLDAHRSDRIIVICDIGDLKDSSVFKHKNCLFLDSTDKDLSALIKIARRMAADIIVVKDRVVYKCEFATEYNTENQELKTDNELIKECENDEPEL